MKKIIYYIKQLFPLIYWSKYKTEGKTFIALWRQWFGKIFNCINFRVNI